MTLRILADDLTGALDAGACFASASDPLPVYWRTASATSHVRAAFDSETRDLPEAEALTKLATWLPELAAADLAFKKVDSLMRGNSVAELLACARSPIFRSVVVAPAFPAQQRLTRNGQQMVAAADAGEPEARGPNLLQVMAAAGRGVPIHMERGGAPKGSGVFVCDAETDEDLACIAAGRDHLERPLLWCGTAGLAHALARTRARSVPPRSVRVLAVVGSRHRVSAEQVAVIREAWPRSIIDMNPGLAEDEVTHNLGYALETSGLAVIVVAYPRELTEKFLSRLHILLRTACSTVHADAYIATGGATLRFLLEAIGCEYVAVEGEIEPGIPLSRVCKGRANGAALISKSGAFGRPSTMRALIEAMRARGAR
jgi:uncharacterized protein YgbK (DUF1537 family)